MNPVIEAARQAAEGGELLAAMTAVFVLFFLGYAAWAWWPSNKAHMDEMARAPLDDDEARRASRGGSR